MHSSLTFFKKLNFAWCIVEFCFDHPALYYENLLENSLFKDFIYKINIYELLHSLYIKYIIVINLIFFVR